MEKFGTYGSRVCLSSRAEEGLIRSAPTYLAKVAIILNNAPDKMLTFSQLLDTLAPLHGRDKKSMEGIIRVCLSSNKCFVKIPVFPDSVRSRKNYWKLDCDQITEKMVRRHFKRVLHLFPELTSKVDSENWAPPLEQQCEPAACAPAAPTVKFSSPFSIESLLRRDSRLAGSSRATPLSRTQFGAEHQKEAGQKRKFSQESERSGLHQASAASVPVWSPGSSRHRGGAPELLCERLAVRPEPLFAAGPALRAAGFPTTNVHVTLCAPTFIQDVLHF